jgi:hypothetical protein
MVKKKKKKQSQKITAQQGSPNVQECCPSPSGQPTSAAGKHGQTPRTSHLATRTLQLDTPGSSIAY